MKTSRELTGMARRLLAAALGMLMSGCSFVSVQRPRPPAEVVDPRVPDTCTASSQAPIADTVLAGVGLIAGYAMMLSSIMDDADCANTSTSTSTCPTGRGAAPGLAVMAAGAVFTGSAIYGYFTTGKCRHRVTVGGRCANGDLASCEKLKPGWAPPPGWRAAPTLEPRPPPAPPASAPPPAAPGSSEWTQEPAQPGATPPPKPQ